MPERLLYSISARGKLSFINFSDSLNAIFSQVHKRFHMDMDFNYLKYQTLRFLDAMGHCEVDFEKRYIYVCPPSLILIPSFGLPKAILTGARDYELIDRLKVFISEKKGFASLHSIIQNRQRYALLPQAIYLEAISKDLIEEAALKVGIISKLDEPAAWSLINFSSDISGISDKTYFELMAEPNWPKRIFSLSDLTFNKSITPTDIIRLAEYTNPRDQQRLHWLWQDDKAAEVDRDWGRFLFLQKQNISVLLYDSKRFLLAIPANIPLPRLISRALTLCTGLAPLEAVLQGKPVPTVPKDCQLNIYDVVVPSIAKEVSNKLGQELIDYNIEVKNGVLS